MAAEATTAAAGGVDPATALANAFGEGLKTIGVGLGIIKGRDDTFRENNQIRFGYNQMANATNAQRLEYVRQIQTKSTKTLITVSSLVAVLVLAFALLHRKQ